MDLLDLFNIQGTLFLMILVGAVVKNWESWTRMVGDASPTCASM